MSASADAPPRILLTDLPPETLSAIYLFLRPIHALHLSHTSRRLSKVTRADFWGLWSLYDEAYPNPRKTALGVPGRFWMTPSHPLDLFLETVRATTCNASKNWHPVVSQTYELEDIDVCKPCEEARYYPAAKDKGLDGPVRAHLLLLALQREGLKLPELWNNHGKGRYYLEYNEGRKGNLECERFIQDGGAWIPDIVANMVSQHVARVHSVLDHLHSEATPQANPWLKRLDEKALEKLACSFYEKAKRMKAAAEVEACFCGRPRTQVLAMRMWEKYARERNESPFSKWPTEL